LTFKTVANPTFERAAGASALRWLAIAASLDFSAAAHAECHVAKTCGAFYEVERVTPDFRVKTEVCNAGSDL